MKCLVVFAALLCACAARPGVYLANHVSLVPGAPIGLDGRVVDTPEVAHAKAEHAAAHLTEKLRNHAVVAPVVHAPVAHAPLAIAPAVSYHAAAAPVVSYHAAAAPVVAVLPGSPIGLDGRVVDTPEVTLAKAQHAAAHVNEKITLAHEAVKSADHIVAAHYIH